MASKRTRAHAALATLVLCALPALAHAQASPEAETLFRDGKQLMKDGKLAEACAAFDASEKAEHNIATVLSLADCREKNGQYASAWGLFLQADSQTRNDAARAVLNATAKKRAAALEGRLSYLTINVPDESRVEGLVVTRDDQPIDPGAWNRAIPVDGGAHVIAGKAPGHESWSTKVTVGAENDKQAVEVPKFKELPKLVNPPGDGSHVEQIITQAPPSPGLWSTRREIGAGFLGGAVVAAGVGLGFGLDARSLRSDAIATCPPSACTAADAASANAENDRARRRALYANVGFGVAGAAAIAAAVLWFTGAPAEGTQLVPTAGAGGAGLSLVGSF